MAPLPQPHAGGLTGLVIVCVLMAVMAVVDTLSLSTRVSGVLTKRLALALSLFQTIVVFSRLSNMIQAPFVGSMVDAAVKNDTVPALMPRFHIIIASVTVGAVIGALMTPTFVRIFMRGIDLFERFKNVPRVVLHFLHPRSLWNLRFYIRPASLGHIVRYWDARTLPKGFLFGNVVVHTFYTIGVLSSIYAGALAPDLRSTCTLLSGVVNGIATFCFFIFVDPTGAMITDQCINGIRPVRDIKVLNLWLVMTKVLGTLIAQLFVVVMAQYVLFFARLVYHISGH